MNKKKLIKPLAVACVALSMSGCVDEVKKYASIFQDSPKSATEEFWNSNQAVKSFSIGSPEALGDYQAVPTTIYVDGQALHFKTLVKYDGSKWDVDYKSTLAAFHQTSIEQIIGMSARQSQIFYRTIGSDIEYSADQVDSLRKKLEAKLIEAAELIVSQVNVVKVPEVKQEQKNNQTPNDGQESSESTEGQNPKLPKASTSKANEAEPVHNSIKLPKAKKDTPET